MAFTKELFFYLLFFFHRDRQEINASERRKAWTFYSARHVSFPADIIVNSAGNPVVVAVGRVGVGQLEVAILRGGVGPRQVVLGSLQFITGPRVAENNGGDVCKKNIKGTWQWGGFSGIFAEIGSS